MAARKHGEAPAGEGEATVTILHVSDMQFGIQHRFGRLGLGGADEPFDTLLERLTCDLDRLREDEGVVPDLVALTGDLAEWGLAEEYEDVLRFCEGVQTHLSLSRDRILVIPGNHDINRDLCLAYFAERKGRRKPLVEPYWPKWGPYVDFFGKLYADVDRYEFKETAPYTWFELPELRVVVAGLNSTMRESHLEQDLKDPESKLGHYGYVGEAQLDWFKKQLDEAAAKGWLRIGLVHHNAVRGAEDDDENLHDAPLLEDRLGDRLNLLLHGHTHRGSLTWLGHDLPVISTGSAAVKGAQRPEEVPNQYQIVQVHREGLRRWARRYTPKERKWIGDTAVSKDGSDWRSAEPVGFPRTRGTFGQTLGVGMAAVALSASMARSPHAGQAAIHYNEVRGPMQLGCDNYVRREADALMARAVSEPRSFPYVLEPRKTGKSSLVVRALARAKQDGAKTLHIDLYLLGRTELDDYANFTRTFAEMLALDLEPHLPGALVDTIFSKRLTENLKLTAVLNETLDKLSERLVVAIDHIEILLHLKWGTNFLELVRGWHSKGSISSVWHDRFNIILAGSSEPLTLISDPHTSPFNVGTRIELTDFTLDEIAVLAKSYGVVVDRSELVAIKDLMGGHPAQTQRLLVHAANTGASCVRMIADGTVVRLFEGDLQRARKAVEESPERRHLLENLGDRGTELGGSTATALYLRGILRREGTLGFWRSRLYREHLFGKRPG